MDSQDDFFEPPLTAYSSKNLLELLPALGVVAWVYKDLRYLHCSLTPAVAQEKLAVSQSPTPCPTLHHCFHLMHPSFLERSTHSSCGVPQTSIPFTPMFSTVHNHTVPVSRFPTGSPKAYPPCYFGLFCSLRYNSLTRASLPDFVLRTLHALPVADINSSTTALFISVSTCFTLRVPKGVSSHTSITSSDPRSLFCFCFENLEIAFVVV